MRGTGLGIIGFSHVGFAVPTVDSFASTWGDVLGVGDWVIHEEYAQDGVFVEGAEPGPLRVKVAFARVGGLAIELIETIEGETCHSRTSKRLAPGLHHLAFWVNDLTASVQVALSSGLVVSMAPKALVASVEGLDDSLRELKEDSGSQGDGHDAGGRSEATQSVPSFFAFLEGFGRAQNFTVELLDRRFANEYLAMNGDQPHPPRPGPMLF